MTEGEEPVAATVRPERKSTDVLEKLDKAGLIDEISLLYNYIEANKLEDLQSLKETEEKLRQQLCDVSKRESILLKTLAEKEREVTDLEAQIEELKQYQLPSNNQLRTMLLEPTVNVVINRLKKELDTTKLRLEESQSELNAWKFTQDSQTGKHLMARCRTLLKENEELGMQISQGRIAKLEGEIALQKKLVEEMKVAQNETEQFVVELDDDTEGLQATILLLQQQLKEAKERIHILEGTGDSTPLQQNQMDTETTESMEHEPTHSELTLENEGNDNSLTFPENSEICSKNKEKTSMVNGSIALIEKVDDEMNSTNSPGEKSSALVKNGRTGVSGTN